MSFGLEDILEDIADATGRAREFVSADAGFLFRRRRVRSESDKRYHCEWMARWRRLHPDLARAADARKYERTKADAKRFAARRARQMDAQRRRRSTPEGRKRASAAALRAYHRAMKDPMKREKIRAKQHAAYLRRKERAV